MVRAQVGSIPYFPPHVVGDEHGLQILTTRKAVRGPANIHGPKLIENQSKQRGSPTHSRSNWRRILRKLQPSGNIPEIIHRQYPSKSIFKIGRLKRCVFKQRQDFGSDDSSVRMLT